MSRPEGRKILLGHGARNLVGLAHVGMGLEHPEGEMSPSPVFRLARFGGEPRGDGRRFVARPRFKEFCEQLHKKFSPRSVGARALFRVVRAARSRAQ